LIRALARQAVPGGVPQLRGPGCARTALGCRVLGRHRETHCAICWSLRSNSRG